MSMRATSYYKFTTTNHPKSGFTTKLYTSSIDSTQALQTLPGSTQTLQYCQHWGRKPEFADVEIFWVIPSILHSSLMNFDANRGLSH
jgi:hypothetical protein